MSSATSYSVGEVKEFQDPSNPDLLNKKGKWFQSRINMANGFKVLMGILIVAAILGGVFWVTRYNERRKLAARAVEDADTTPRTPARSSARP